MAPRNTRKRIAVATLGHTTHEAQIARGVLAYSNVIGSWDFVLSRNRPFILFEHLNLSEVDGVISNFSDPHWIERVKSAKVPAVNTSSRFDDIAIPTVSHDDVAVGRMAGEYLLGLGFEHLAFVTAGDAGFSRRRLDGFRQVVQAKAGKACHILKSQGYERTPIEKWLSGLPRPVAILAATDVRGWQAIEAANRIGLRVPDDVAVLGVDNDEWLTQLASIPMSSIQTDGRQVGYHAAALLDQLISRARGGQATAIQAWRRPRVSCSLPANPKYRHEIPYFYAYYGLGMSLT